MNNLIIKNMFFENHTVTWKSKLSIYWPHAATERVLKIAFIFRNYATYKDQEIECPSASTPPTLELLSVA